MCGHGQGFFIHLLFFLRNCAAGSPERTYTKKEEKEEEADSQPHSCAGLLLVEFQWDRSLLLHGMDGFQTEE